MLKKISEVRYEEDIIKLNDEAHQRMHGIKVICGDCKKKVNITYAVQCFYCNYWICRDCGKEHFKKTMTDEEFRMEKFKRDITESMMRGCMSGLNGMR